MILQLRIYIKQNSAGNLYLNLTTNFIQTFIPRSSVLLLCTNHAISLSKSMPMHAHAQVWTKQHIWYSIIIWSKIDAWSGEEDGEAKDEQLRLGNDDRRAAAHSDGRLHSTMTRVTPELQPECSFPMPVLLILPCFSTPSMKTTPARLSYGDDLRPIQNHDMWRRRIENTGRRCPVGKRKRIAWYKIK